MKKRFLSLVMALCMLVCAVPSFASGTESIGPWIADLKDLAKKSVEYNNIVGGVSSKYANCYINLVKSSTEITYSSDGIVAPNGREVYIFFGESLETRCKQDYTFGFKFNATEDATRVNIQMKYVGVDSNGSYESVSPDDVGNYLIRYKNDQIRVTSDFSYNNNSHKKVDIVSASSTWHEVRFEVDYPDSPTDSEAFSITTYIDNQPICESAKVPQSGNVSDKNYTIKAIDYIILRSLATSRYKDIYMYPGIGSANVATDLSGDKVDVTDIKIYQGNSFIHANGSYNKNEALKISALLSNEDTSATMPCTLMLAEYTSDNQLLQLIPVSKELNQATSKASYTDILGTSLIPSADSHHIKVFVMDSQNTIIPLSQSVYLTASTN